MDGMSAALGTELAKLKPPVLNFFVLGGGVVPAQTFGTYQSDFICHNRTPLRPFTLTLSANASQCD
jgi:hypothetical protein